MRKLLMFAAAAAVAVASQAAQFNWGATQIREGWGNADNKASGTAYLFLVGSEVTEASIASAISGATDATALATTLAGKAVDTKDVSAGATGGLSPEGIAATSPSSLFFVAISSDGHVYQSSAISIDEVLTLGSTDAVFGSQKSASSAASAWKTVGGGSSGGGDVPEPTSGLLLLVGGAMLALRRKQK